MRLCQNALKDMGGSRRGARGVLPGKVAGSRGEGIACSEQDHPFDGGSSFVDGDDFVARMHLHPRGYADVVTLSGRAHIYRMLAEDGFQIGQPGLRGNELENEFAGPFHLVVKQALKPFPTGLPFS